MSTVNRRFRDRDYIETPEGFFFCVLGSIHPPDRVFAYLKYVPDQLGKWGVGKKRYRRILKYYTMDNLVETFKFLENWPKYLFFSDKWNVHLSAVPLRMIKRHFKPEERLLELLSKRSLDVLEDKAVRLIKIISERSGVPVEFFGLTGSILLGIHQPFSDIDVIVYGKRNRNSVKKALLSMYEEASPIKRFGERQAKEWCLNKVRLYPLTYEDARRILAKKWSRGVFEGIMFSVHPVKLEGELLERYEEVIFRPKGLAKIEATVKDASESDFMPAKYIVEKVRFIDGRKVDDLLEVVSFEGLYGGVAEKGEKIICYGKIEEVFKVKENFKYHRLLVGSREAGGKDFIKPLS